MRVDPRTVITLGAPVTNAESADSGFSFHITVPSQLCVDTVIASLGNGYNFSINDHPQGLSPNVNFSGRSNQFTAVWDGYLVPTVTGTYNFYTQVDDHIIVDIYDGGTQTMHHETDIGAGEHDNVFLKKGVIYHVIVSFNNEHKPQYLASLRWLTPKMKCLNQEPDFIPTNQVYSTAAAAAASISTSSKPYYKLGESKAEGKAFSDQFTLLQGKKMVLGAWAKETTKCKCSTYVNNHIEISFDGNRPLTFQPAGNIIEGWQRYEAIFTVPDDATNISVTFKSTDSNSVYFDDVRIHPFNANEKSFVYHSSNLRLMAELDENNYASFYEYDDDGTLTRVKKETEKGIKTITETRSALQKTD